MGESPPPDGGGTHRPDLTICYNNDAQPHQSPYQQRRNAPLNDGLWQSPLPLRKHFNTDVQQLRTNNTSPILLQRFYHQQKQYQQQAAVDKEQKDESSGKKRFASHIKLQLVSDRGGFRSRHQSPEPPPRLSRGSSTENSIITNNQSPLAMRRNFLETTSGASPSFSRRY